jgi:hypothetical protein
MHKYIVRLWVDIEVFAETQNEAKEIAKKVPVEVKDADIYDTQVANVYETE